ncbi:Gfo/Idh/MocA family oxidoreductase [Synechocystis sp. FACHB-383]|uniref:Gfo/Idh/MocA family protein n=1 Tax=Synechocystis sp. FACHB-383 TaxID=2692864 RepID=UPI001683EDB3|nr:Gfo/Idh/MocA family oxidoreductase [Synechocystis sp. FACHB-383]MBD2653409.1 Gfo/Idh/MocA family oxidoreductase [Synechocystis sp. FACHB-383]
MTNSSTLTVAVIGTGFGQAVHLPALQYHDQTQAIAIYHRDLTKAKEVAQSQGLPHSYDNLPELLANPNIKAVTVASPPFLHFEMARDAILAGKHVLLEKPMTLRVEETIELYHLAQQRGVTVMPDFEFRFVPAWQYVAELLQREILGKLRLIKVDWLVGSRANAERAWNWYAQREKGGGALGALASHTFDYLHWLFGPAHSLSANLSVAIAERPDPLDNNRLKPVTAEDTALISLTLDNDIPCQVNITSVAHGGRGHWLEIYGEKGSLVLGSENLKDYVHGFKIFHHPAGEPMQKLKVPTRLDFPKVFADGRLAPVVRVVDEWAQSIFQKRTPTPSLRHGVYSQLLMDLTHQAHQKQQWVPVPDLDRLLAR